MSLIFLYSLKKRKGKGGKVYRRRMRRSKGGKLSKKNAAIIASSLGALTALSGLGAYKYNTSKAIAQSGKDIGHYPLTSRDVGTILDDPIISGRDIGTALNDPTGITHINENILEKQWKKQLKTEKDLQNIERRLEVLGKKPIQTKFI